MFNTEKHHKDTLQQMEHKFFEEKVFAYCQCISNVKSKFDLQ